MHIARFEVLKQLEELEDKTVRRGVISNYPDDRIINDWNGMEERKPCRL